MRLLLVDNYDSFTFNLAQLLEEAGAPRPEVFPRDKVDLHKVKEYDRILFSPGPGLPDDSPLLHELLRRYAGTKPILGVCLGHQAIATFFGGELFRQEGVVHGIRKTIHIAETGSRLFRGLKLPLEVGLYHSWAVAPQSIHPDLKVTAWSDDGLIMALEHRQFSICGVQFHPESYMTDVGTRLIRNWLELG